jgi:putative addiction module killer protein
MVEVRQTREFSNWLFKLQDRAARARIEVRIRRLGLGLAGDVKPVGEGISELRIDYGPGYRVYFCQRGREIVLLLVGGDKRTQDRDIRAARQLAQEW